MNTADIRRWVADRREADVVDGDIGKAYSKDRARKVLFIVFMSVIALFAFFYTVGVGNYEISAKEALEVVKDKLLGRTISEDDQFYVWDMYVPRALGGVLVGGGLAIGGAIMQNILRNPLAEPYTMGISSGAMFGATMSIALGFSVFPFLDGYSATVANAFVFSLVPAMIILLIAVFKKVTPVMMILTGIAVMYLFSSITSLVMVSTNSETMQDIYYWNIGTLSRATWDNLPTVAASTIILSAILYALSSRLDLMYIGDRSAQSLGLKVNAFRIIVLMLTSFLTAGLVSCTGTIGFVGLVAPHVARIFVGAGNRYLLPASAAFGIAFLLIADTIAKSIGAGNLPVGVISSLVGGPLFMYILIRGRRRAWM